MKTIAYMTVLLPETLQLLSLHNDTKLSEIMESELLDNSDEDDFTP